MSAPTSRTVLLATCLVLACRPAAKTGGSTVFSYSASDGEFGYSIDVDADGRWRRSEHSGSAEPEGRLSGAQLRRFLALLDAAPFRTQWTPCDLETSSEAVYTDARNGRTAKATQGKDADGRWQPCGATPDPITRQLPQCLSVLIDGSDAGACDAPALADETEPPAPAPAADLPVIPPVEGPTCDGVDLDVVAACFQQAVAIVQEDAAPEGRLLDRAASSGKLSPACAKIGRDPATGALVTTSGQALLFERSTSPWDHNEDGSATLYLDYTITCACCQERKAFTITYSAG